MNILGRNIIHIIKPFRRKLLFAAFLSGTSLFMAIGLLAASAWLISMASTRPPILTLQVAIVAVRFFGLGRGVFRYASRLLEHDAALEIQSAIRQELYKNLESFTPNQFAKLRRGQLLRQSVIQTEEIQDIWLRILLPWLSAIIAATAGISIIIFLLPIAAVALSIVFLIALITLTFVAAFSSSRINYRQNSDQLFDQIMQSCESSQEAALFDFKKQLESQIDLAQNKLDLIDSRDSKTVGITSALHSLSIGVAVLISAILAAHAYASGNLSGINVAVITLLPLVIFDNLNVIPSTFSKVRQHLESAQSIDRLLEPEQVISSPFEEPISFSKLTFSNSYPVLTDSEIVPVSAAVEKKNPLLIMGVSGVGKSSFINALCGFIPYEGSIDIDGIELRKINQENKSLIFTTLLQNDYLFNSSIRENLRIANQSASDEQLLAALADVELEGLIRSLPQGLDTHIGAYGYNFSGGEKQRIRLARVLLRNTPIYLLDEPFEFLDSSQAQRISQVLLDRLQDKLLIIVSHQEISGIHNLVNLFKR